MIGIIEEKAKDDDAVLIVAYEEFDILKYNSRSLP